MAKKLRVVDRLLLGIAFIDEVFGEPVRLGYLARKRGKLGFWTPPNYKGSEFRQSVYRMLKTGSVAKRVINGEPELILTNKGKQIVKRRFSFFKQQEQKWDGHWRLIIFDISEKERSIRQKLRHKLLELGFGMWQKSIYISPFSWEEDMAEFLEAEKIYGKAWVLTAKHRLLGEAKDLAESIWHLSELNKKYNHLLNRLNKSELTLERVRKICYDYSNLLINDPCLPKELLPVNWAAFKVKEKLKNITNKYPIG